MEKPSNVWSGINDTASTAWNGVKSIGGKIKMLLQEPGNGAKNLAGNAWEELKNILLEMLKTKAVGIWNTVSRKAGGIYNNIKNILDPLTKVWNTIWRI